jgi:hypothetical protein
LTATSFLLTLAAQPIRPRHLSGQTEMRARELLALDKARAHRPRSTDHLPGRRRVALRGRRCHNPAHRLAAIVECLLQDGKQTVQVDGSADPDALVSRARNHGRQSAPRADATGDDDGFREVLVRLRGGYRSLSAAERRVGDAVAADPQALIRLPLRALAESAGSCR